MVSRRYRALLQFQRRDQQKVTLRLANGSFPYTLARRYEPVGILLELHASK